MLQIGPVLPPPAALRVRLTILVLVLHPVMPTQQAEHVAPHPDSLLPPRGQRKGRRLARERLASAALDPAISAAGRRPHPSASSVGRATARRRQAAVRRCCLTLPSALRAGRLSGGAACVG